MMISKKSDNDRTAKKSDDDGTIGQKNTKIKKTPNFKVNSSVVNQEDVNKSTAYAMCEKRMALALK